MFSARQLPNWKPKPEIVMGFRCNSSARFSLSLLSSVLVLKLHLVVDGKLAILDLAQID